MGGGLRHLAGLVRLVNDAMVWLIPCTAIPLEEASFVVFELRRLILERGFSTVVPQRSSELYRSGEHSFCFAKMRALIFEKTSSVAINLKQFC